MKDIITRPILDYVICKKLKDAGFPQEVPADEKVMQPNGNLIPAWTGDKDSVHIPDFYDIIEWCGKLVFVNPQDFNLHISRINGLWTAQTFEGNIENLKKGTGSTAEEAMVNLGLALYKRNEML